MKGRGKYATTGISGVIFTPTLALPHQGGGEFKVAGQPPGSPVPKGRESLSPYEKWDAGGFELQSYGYQDWESIHVYEAF
jgi:hypothetical protein